MAFFGLSPLFLSLLASRFFTDPTTGLNVTRFMFFLAFASGITHLIGAFTLRIPTSQCGVASKSDGVAPVASCDEEQSSIDERQPLLPKTPRSGVQAVDANEGSSVLHLFRDPCFWSLAFVVLIILGSVSFRFAKHYLFIFDRLSAVRNDYLEYRNYCAFSVS